MTAGIGAALYQPIIIGGVAGFIAGLVLVMLLSRRADRITSPSAVLGLFSEPILGQIPVAQESRGEGGVPLLQRADPRVKYAEAFRSLRSSLLFMGFDGSARSLLVTSSALGEGASTVASNLAVTMAEAGTRTLLIDANGEQGSVGKIFRVDDRHGVANVLSGQTAWDSAVQQTAYPNLTVLTAGSPPASSSAERAGMAALIEQASAAYELVVVDAAPAVAGSTTVELAKQMAGTLVVLRRNVTPARRAKSALAQLKQEQVKVSGLVLNCIDPDSSEFSYNQSSR